MFLDTLVLNFRFPFSPEQFRLQRKGGESAHCACNFLPGSGDCRRNNADSTQNSAASLPHRFQDFRVRLAEWKMLECISAIS